MTDIEKAREALAGKWYVVSAEGECHGPYTDEAPTGLAKRLDRYNIPDAPHIVCQLTPVTAQPATLDEDRMVWEAAVAFASAGNFTPESAIVRARALLAAFKEAAK